MSGASLRKLVDEAKKTLQKVARATQEFDALEVAFDLAAELPDVEEARSTGMHTHVGSVRGLLVVNPKRTHTLARLEEGHRALARLRPAIEQFEANHALAALHDELYAARCTIAKRALVFSSKQITSKVKNLKSDEEAKKEQQLAETREWVQAAVQRLRDRVDALEAEAEALGEGKAARKAKEAGAQRLELAVRTHRAHDRVLEALTRMLDNGIVTPAEADELRSDVDAYLDDEAGATASEDAARGSLAIYDAIEKLRAFSDGDEGDGDDDSGGEAAAAGAGASMTSGGAALASASASGTSAPERAPTLRVCTRYARRGKGGCRFGDACPENHALIDKAVAMNACAPYLVNACATATDGQKCRRLHLMAKEVRARSAASAAAQAAGSLVSDAALTEALRPLVLTALHEAGGRLGISALVERPGLAFFLAALRTSHPQAKLSNMLRGMSGVGIELRDGAIDIFDSSAPVSASSAAVSVAPAAAASRAAAAALSQLQPELPRDDDCAAAAALEGYDEEDPDGAMAQAERERNRRDLARLAAARPLGDEEDEAAAAAAVVAAANTPERLLSDAAARLAAQRRLLSLRSPRAPRSLDDAASAAELLSAVCAGDETLWRLLSDAGAGTEAADGAGATPLLCACLRRDERCAAALLAAGANPNARDAAGRTPLLIAAFFGLAEIVPMLVAEGADASASGPGRYTALHWACYLGHDSLAVTLLAAGASFACVSDVGSTPLSLCEAGGGRTPQALAVLRMLSAGGDAGGAAGEGTAATAAGAGASEPSPAPAGAVARAIASARSWFGV